jgi:hypothetical protein
VQAASWRFVLKIIGGILMFVAISVVGRVVTTQPDPDRTWFNEGARFIVAGMFLGGLWLFGAGLKSEIIKELRNENR